MNDVSPLSNVTRAELVDKALEERNRILRSYAETGVPNGVYVPKSMTQYRLWEDSNLGIVRIGSPNSINVRCSSPARVKLIKEASVLVVKLRSSLKKPAPKRKSHSELHGRDQNEIVRLRKLVSGMASTIQQLNSELETALTARDQMSTDFANLKREMDSLRRSIGKPTGIRLVESSRRKKDEK
ncbi:hypothetical protein I5588_16290 [Burkholderia multivorans]|uniref:hypothetical protein n=1 Tax=Burkholderia multivorans TaxID=87883 RepID=UPI001906E89C|nr:hypothetical protein [Burkholderia multivorans]MBJ9656112.1 hypothetical protein [Burkholderia multivorans]